MDDIILWLDTLEPGTEILTPDDWALGKRADGTWEFVIPCGWREWAGSSMSRMP